MNAAHLHLILNHLPIVGMPVALVFLLHSFRAGGASSRRFALLVLMASALSAVPVYFSGEGAEDVVEQLPGVVESMIEQHEEAGEVAMILSVLTGVLALAAWFVERAASAGGRAGARVGLFRGAVTLATLLSVVALAYAGNLGGKIRHTEVRASGSVLDSGSSGERTNGASEVQESAPGQNGGRDDD